MPGKALTVGGGAARGVKAFLASFQQAKMYEHQEKMQKNAVAVEFLAKQLEDPYTTYKDRARILRAIPRLYGLKDESFDPLMRMLDASNEEDVTVQEGQPGQKGKQAQPIAPLTSQETSSPNEGQTLPQRQLESTSDVSAIPELVRKKGDMTPAQLRSMLVVAQNKATNEDDLDKQTKLIKVQYNLQNEIFGKGGYTERLPYTFDQDKNLIMRWRRPTDGDIQSKNMGKVTTEAIEKANINADVPKGKFGALQQANQIKAAYEADPTSYPEWQYNAAKSLLDEFERHGQVQNAQITALTQGNTGTKPIQPPQKADDVRADNQNRLTIQKDIDEASAEANAARTRMKEISSDLKAASDEAVKADKILATTEFEVGDPEWNKLSRDAEIKRARYDNLKADYDRAHGNETLANSKLTGAQGRLKGASVNNTDNTKYKPAIDRFRTNNANTKFSSWSDEQIINYLIGKGLIKQ